VGERKTRGPERSGAAILEPGDEKNRRDIEIVRRGGPLPTDAELALLRVLRTDGPDTVRTVQDRLDPEQGYTTALKHLQITHGNGLVPRDERGGPLGATPSGRAPVATGLRAHRVRRPSAEGTAE